MPTFFIFTPQQYLKFSLISLNVQKKTQLPESIRLSYPPGKHSHIIDGCQNLKQSEALESASIKFQTSQTPWGFFSPGFLYH
jgi:hypothetical protein